jgi:signal transduction histidine kinase
MATDTNGIIRSFNVGAERMLGYSVMEAVNSIAFVDIHDPQELRARAHAVSQELATTIAADFEAVVCKASSECEDRYESTLIRKNRTRVAVAILVTVLRDDLGRTVGYLLNLTESSAAQADFSKPDLLAHLSHEMRTPLSAMLGFAQLMESGMPPPSVSQKRSIDLILQAGWYLEKLINMTRDLALVESGMLSLSLEPVALSAAMLECQAMIMPQAKMRGVRVMFPQIEAPFLVCADRIRLQQVLGNLLSAAIEETEPGGAVVVNWEAHGSEWIRIAITDGSEGSSSERSTQRFHPFNGLERESTAAAEAKLALLLAGRLVVSMGGAIGAHSTAGPRTLFSFDLNRARAAMDATRT